MQGYTNQRVDSMGALGHFSAVLSNFFNSWVFMQQVELEWVRSSFFGKARQCGGYCCGTHR